MKPYFLCIALGLSGCPSNKITQEAQLGSNDTSCYFSQWSSCLDSNNNPVANPPLTAYPSRGACEQAFFQSTCQVNSCFQCPADSTYAGCNPIPISYLDSNGNCSAAVAVSIAADNCLKFSYQYTQITDAPHSPPHVFGGGGRDDLGSQDAKWYTQSCTNKTGASGTFQVSPTDHFAPTSVSIYLTDDPCDPCYNVSSTQRIDCVAPLPSNINIQAKLVSAAIGNGTINNVVRMVSLNGVSANTLQDDQFATRGDFPGTNCTWIQDSPNPIGHIGPTKSVCLVSGFEGNGCTPSCGSGCLR